MPLSVDAVVCFVGVDSSFPTDRRMAPVGSTSGLDMGRGACPCETFVLLFSCTINVPEVASVEGAGSCFVEAGGSIVLLYR